MSVHDTLAGSAPTGTYTTLDPLRVRAPPCSSELAVSSTARRCKHDGLTKRTGFRADRSAVVAGALMYTQYSWLKRVVMQHISRKEGGSTDTSRDHEYTDWNEVDAFTSAFAELVMERTRVGHATSRQVATG